MDSLPDPPPGLDLTQTNVPRFVASTCLTWVMGVACVGLRFFARKLTRGGFWWDDWIILTTLVRNPIHPLWISRKALTKKDMELAILFRCHLLQYVSYPEEL